MMQTVEESRVSLDDEYDLENNWSHNSKRGIKQGDAERKEKDGLEKDGPKKKTQIAQWLTYLFGPALPIIGTETWVSVGTSWLISDVALLIWRILAFAGQLSVYMYMARTHRADLKYFSVDVFAGSVASATMLVLPPVAQLIVGPHEDELDARPVRWLWTVVSIVAQLAVTNVIVVTGAFYVTLPMFGGSKGLALGLDAIPAAVLLGELMLSCVRTRLSYAVLGTVAAAAYLGLLVGRLHHGIGPWMRVLLEAAGRGGIARFAAFGGLIAGYLLVGLLVVALERSRTRTAEWLERRRALAERW